MEDASIEEQATQLEKINVVQQLTNLLTFDNIRERVTSGQLALNGWHYNIGVGEISIYNQTKEMFEIF